MNITRQILRHTLSIAILAAGTLPFSVATTVLAQGGGPTKPVADRVTQSIDENRRVTLSHTVHPLARAANDRGVVADSKQLDRIQMVLKRSDAQESALKQLIGDMHRPGTATYHKWLTPEAFGKQFGPSDADVAKLQAWLGSHGFGGIKLNPGRQTIEFSASASQFQGAFHAPIHRYVVKGETHYANAADPQIPEALAPLVLGFASLNNFNIKSHSTVKGKAAYDPKTGRAQPQWTKTASYGDSFVMSPGDFSVEYDLNPLYTAGTDGTGQTIAIINEANIDVSRVNDFRTLFGLPSNPPNVILDGNDPGIDGVNNPDQPNGASIESYLDVEWAGAVAPKATIDLVIAADTALSSGLILAANRAVYDNLAPVISLSFGECELNGTGGLNQFFQTLWEQAAAQGITVVVSTGDNGSAGCDNPDSQDYADSYGKEVSGFATTPYNVAVGGTDFYYSAYNQGNAAIDAQLATYWDTTPSNNTATVSIKGFIPEQAWNDSQYGSNLLHSSTGETTIGAGSGGASSFGLVTDAGSGPYPKPSWQSGNGVPADGVRDIPDVSLFAAPGANQSFFPVCVEDGDCQPVSAGGSVQIVGIGGTSASAPSFAGMMALVNQKYGRQGQADFVLYPLAAQFPAAFHDVVYGTNSVPCQGGSLDCIPVQNPVTDIDGTVEGQIGDGTGPAYNAAPGYDLATGLGTIDANQMVANWNNVTFAASTTTLTPSSTSFSHGTSISLSGSVTATATPTGSVVLRNDSPIVSQGGQNVFELTNGSYSGTTNALPGGTYNIWAQYSGDGVNAPSASDKTQITVTPETSYLDFAILNVASQGNSTVNFGSHIPYGTQCVLTAEPAPSSSSAHGSPTGSVTFKDNSVVIDTASMNGYGEASYNAAFAVGSHLVSAQYAGDASFSASNAQAINFTVTKNTPGIGLSSPAQLGDTTYQGGTGAIVFAIQVVNVANEGIQQSSGAYIHSPVAPPTGTVLITGFPAGLPTSVALQSALDYGSGFPEGVGSITAPALAPGVYNLAISYPGDANYNAASRSISITVVGSNQLASTIAATSPATATSYGAAVKIAAAVTGQAGSPAPTGTVTIVSSSYVVDRGKLVASGSDVSSTTFTETSQSLLPGQNLLTLQYSGDSIYQPSSTSLTVTNGAGPGVQSFAVSATGAAIAAPGSSATSSIIVAPSDGFTGTVALTCAVTSPAGATDGPTCAAASVQITGNLSAATTLTINTTAATAGATYTLTLTGTSGGMTATTTLPVVVAASTVPGFTLAASPINITSPGSSGTASVTITPVAQFTGAVALSCSVTGGGGSDSPTCSVSAPAAITSAAMVAAALTVNTTTATADGMYTVTISGVSGSITGTATAIVTVSGTAIIPNFALSGAAITNVTPGVAATTNITVTPSEGFTGTVALACSITSAPAGSQYPPTCTVTSPPAIAGTTAVTATLTLESTAPSSSASMKPLLFVVGGGATLASLFLGLPIRRRKWKSLLIVLFGIFGLATVGAMTGCGSSSTPPVSTTPTSPTPPTTPTAPTTVSGTTAGTYTVTITGTSGGTTQKVALNVTIN